MKYNLIDNDKENEYRKSDFLFQEYFNDTEINYFDESLFSYDERNINLIKYLLLLMKIKMREYIIFQV